MGKEDWSDSMDDMESGDWEDYLGGPDDDELESFYESEEYENMEVDWPEDTKKIKSTPDAVCNVQSDNKNETRQVEIIDWLSSLKLAIKFKNGKGFFVPKGPLIRLSENNVMDLLEWLYNEGIKGRKAIGGYNIVHTSPESKYGEKLSFFKMIVDSPFSTNSNCTKQPSDKKK